MCFQPAVTFVAEGVTAGRARHAEEGMSKTFQPLVTADQMTAAVTAQPRALVADDVEVR